MNEFADHLREGRDDFPLNDRTLELLEVVRGLRNEKRDLEESLFRARAAAAVGGAAPHPAPSDGGATAIIIGGGGSGDGHRAADAAASAEVERERERLARERDGELMCFSPSHQFWGCPVAARRVDRCLHSHSSSSSLS